MSSNNSDQIYRLNQEIRYYKRCITDHNNSITDLEDERDQLFKQRTACVRLNKKYQSFQSTCVGINRKIGSVTDNLRFPSALSSYMIAHYHGNLAQQTDADYDMVIRNINQAVTDINDEIRRRQLSITSYNNKINACVRKRNRLRD